LGHCVSNAILMGKYGNIPTVDRLGINAVDVPRALFRLFGFYGLL
jgi:hypothetical protein